VLDNGIFDALAQLMASDEVLDSSNTRLVSQALWSSGRMVEFEVRPARDEEADNEGDPPYVECAQKYIRYLVANQDRMTPKHIAQSIWSIGRLRLSDSFLVREMADIASR